VLRGKAYGRMAPSSSADGALFRCQSFLAAYLYAEQRTLMEADQRVLIAESDEGVRRRLYGKLLDLEVFSDCAADGREALERLSERHYCLIILDLSLPVIDPMRILEQIRQTRSEQAPIVVAVATRGTTPSLDADTVQIIVRKPFKPTELAEVVRNCLRSARAEETRVASRNIVKDAAAESMPEI
jgi:DNA-binding response OmpR family regulator